MKTRTALLALLTILCLMLAVAPALANTVYDNGPYNGTADAWTINFGFAVSDSFTLSAGNVDTFHFVYWDASSSDLLTTADLQLGTTSFGGSTTTVAFSNTFLGTNQYGYNLYQADASLLSVPWAGGAGFATLGNACSTSGCSVSNPIYWDENSGPSTAYENTIGSIPSEAFTLTGSSGPPPGDTPDASSIMLFGSGIFGLVAVLRRKLGR
jgi:hypothetical protein